MNKSELILEQDINMTTSNISELGKVLLILDNSIMVNKTNTEMKRSEQLIEQLNMKLEIHFEYVSNL